MTEKWITNSTGYLELVNIETGDILAREKKKRPPRHSQPGQRRPGRPSKQDLSFKKERELYPYSPTLAERLVDALVMGGLITKLDSEAGLPPYQAIQKWRHEHPDFDRQVQSAFEARAYYFEDKILEIAEGTFSQDEVPRARLMFDAYTRLLALSAPRRKPTSAGKSLSPTVTFRICTGVPEPDEPSD